MWWIVSELAFGCILLTWFFLCLSVFWLVFFTDEFQIDEEEDGEL